MKKYNNIFCMLFFFILNITLAQDSKSFFIEIPGVNNIPIITHDKNGNRKAYSKTTSSKLDKLFNSYKIFSCKKVFKSSKREALQNIYLIECDDLKLMNDLITGFKEIYPKIEPAEVEILTLPDDFGVTGGFIREQEELNYIRAPEVWDNITTGRDNIIIGVSDTSVRILHEDLETKVTHVFGNNFPDNLSTYNVHGSAVASMAAANTNNGLGMSAIGYNSSIYSATNNFVTGVDTLSLMARVKVINTAWVNSSNPEMYNEVVEDRGVVVVGSAGNNNTQNPSDYIYPAAFKNVISVSAIGHNNETISGPGYSYEVFIDHHEYKDNGTIKSFQHNDSVDIVAPAYGVVLARPKTGFKNNGYYSNKFGTSFASPMVSGTIALMFDVNYCIGPKEVETILKLTAVKIDTLPQNIQYYGKLGAGKLDAYEAVKMAKDMADTFGTVEVKNRILYRAWFYKLVTAPYEIKMTNNDVTGGAKLKFKARNNIEILSGNYYPSNGGYIDLSIDTTLASDCPLPPPISNSSSKNKKNRTDNIEDEIFESINNGLLVFPNPTKGILNIANKEDLNEIIISDITGENIYFIEDINAKEILVNISRFNSGIYFMKIRTKTGYIIDRKIIKE